MKLLMFFLQGIPECIGAIAVSLALAGVQLRWRIIAVSGAVLALLLFLIRSLPLTFGIHTIAALLLVVIFLNYTTTVSTSKALLVSIISLGMLALMEILVLEPYFALTHVTLAEAQSNVLHWSLLGLLQALLLNLAAVLIAVFRKEKKDEWKI